MLLRECEQTDFIDRAEIARREAQGNVPSEFRHPKATPLDVHLLPARGLDVGVRNVPRAQLALACDLTLGHGAAEAS